MSFIVFALILAPSPGQVAAFQSEILAADSATAVLQQYCSTSQITALRKPARAKAPPNEVRARLKLLPGETLRYRRVRLNCGNKTLSKADNWYVPERLTSAMNTQLESTDTPYGRVIAPLKAKRETLVVIKGKYKAAFAVSAVLVSADGVPLSAVVERYRLHPILTP